MADVSHVSMSLDTPNKGKSRPRHDKNRRAFSLVSPGGKDVHSAVVAGLSRENVGGRATPIKEKKRHKAKKSLESTSVGAADAGVAQEASDLLPTPPGSKTSRKGKGKAIKDVDPLTEQIEEDRLPFLRLSEPLGKSARLPPVFSQDGRFCFVAAASSVKIYNVTSCQLLSTLDLPGLAGKDASNATSRASNQITSLFINPVNALQVVTTSLDGHVRVWDYLEGKVLYNADMGGPISCAAIVGANSPAYQQAHIRESLFLAVNRGSTLPSITGSAKQWQANPPTSIVFCISLKRSEISKQVRLGKCKDAVAISVSGDGNSVVVIGRKKIHIAQIGESKRSVVSKAPFISFEGLPSTTYYREITFTTVVCHPTESYFATGDTRGSIRLWYILNEESLATLRVATEQTKESGKKGNANVVPSTAMSVLHWHAHAVSSLAFTPNGAYLLSGGEEAVLVIWQIASRHKEFVPRIGAPIEALNVINGASGQQEFVARLKDGAIVFVGAGTLKVIRTIAGVKSIGQFSKKEGSNLPLAIEPLSNRLVFQASHPSTIQFYSATQDIHVYEQDISPSNRVSRTDERPIEPVRVEQIAFSAAASPSTASASNASVGALQLAADNRGAVWMATFDTWQDREYTRESHLKFWMGYPSHKPGYGLVSRIDNPHGQERLSSMCFAPSSSSSTDGGVAKLCTTSLDGTIKLWQYKALDIPKSKKNNTNTNHLQGIWQCLYSLSYRSLGAVNASFSKDGSLLAIAHKSDKVTLWDVESGNLVKAFNVRVDDIGKIRCVAFGGLLGTRLIAGGEKGHVIWDLLTCEEINIIPVPASQILISPDTPSDTYLAISHKTSTVLSLADPNMRQIEVLPFSLASCTAYPTPSYYPFTSTSTSTQGQSNAPVIASIAKSGQVALLGHEQALRQVRPAAFESSTVTLQSALQSTGNGADEELRPVRLFDELFGPSSLSAAPSTSTSTTTAALTYDMDALKMAAGPGSGGKRDIFDEIPSHKLPSLSELWRGLLLPKLKPVSSSNGRGQASKSEEGVKDEDVSDEEEGEGENDDEPQEDDGTEHDYDHDNDEMDEDVTHQEGDAEGEPKLDEEEEEASIAKQESTYENLPDEELARIFAQCMPSTFLNNTSSSPGKGSTGIPSDRMAGKAGKDKNKKKRKSLLASMV